MPKTSEMRGPSKYLSKDDVGKGLLVTITGVTQVNFTEGDKPGKRWILQVQENPKGLVLNSTNIQIIARIAGSDDTDDWNGFKVVLYVDPNVSYAGKLVGGVRIREPKAGTKADLENASRAREKGHVAGGADDEQLSSDDIGF